MLLRTCCWVSSKSASLRSVSGDNRTSNRAFLARSCAREITSRRNSFVSYTVPVVLFVIVNVDMIETIQAPSYIHLFFVILHTIHMDLRSCRPLVSNF